MSLKELKQLLLGCTKHILVQDENTQIVAGSKQSSKEVNPLRSSHQRSQFKEFTNTT